MKHYQIHHLVKVTMNDAIQANVQESIDFQIGFFQVKTNPDNCKYSIIISPYEEAKINELEMEIFHLVQGSKKRFYHDPVKKFAVDYGPKTTNLYVTDDNFLISIYIQLYFLKEGITMVHAAAVCNPENDEVTLLPGPGGVGKTAILHSFVIDRGYKTLGDDIIGISKEGKCYAFPRAFVLKKYHQETYKSVFDNKNIRFRNDPSQRLVNFFDLIFNRLIFRNLPFHGLMNSLIFRSGLIKYINAFREPEDFFTASLEEVFGNESVALSGNLKHVLFLERVQSVQGMRRPIEKKEIVDRMFAIINHEWVEMMREIYSLGALEIIDLKVYFDDIYETIHGAMDAPEQLQILKIPRSASPAELVHLYEQTED